MKSFQFKSLLLLAALVISLPSFGQGLKAFKLKNGLSIYMGRRIQIGRIRTGRRTCRFHQ